MTFANSFLIKVWRRHEAELSFVWNTYAIEQLCDIQPNFQGIIRESPVTGKPEKYFPRWKKRLRYIVSFIFTLPMLIIAVAAMLCSLNLNGYIKDKDSPIYLSSLARYAEPVSAYSIIITTVVFIIFTICYLSLIAIEYIIVIVI